MTRRKGKKGVVNEAVDNFGRFNKVIEFWNRIYYSIYCILTFSNITAGTMAIVVISPILICAHILAIVYGAGAKALLFNHYGLILIILFLLCLLFEYIVLWKDSRYLKYFSKFEKESRKKKITWCIGVAIYCIILLVAWLWTLTRIPR